MTVESSTRNDDAEALTTGAEQQTVTSIVPISNGKFTMGNTNCCYSKFARPPAAGGDQRGGKKKKKRRKHNKDDGGGDAKVTRKAL